MLSSLYSKPEISASRFDVYLFHVIDHSPLWTSRQIVLEGFDTFFRSFSKSFHGSVRAITNIANNLVFGRSSLRKESITNSLHFTFYQELTRNFDHNVFGTKNFREGILPNDRR